MGNFLSEPIVEKQSQDEYFEHLDIGVSGMQGWRTAMEDAYLSMPDLDGKKNSLFGVFDGHGGCEVAEYCAINFHKFLMDTEAYQEGEMTKALKDSFLNVDEALTSDEVIEELKRLGGIEDRDDKEEADEAAMLLEEANMPIEDLLIKIKEDVKEKLVEKGLLEKDKDTIKDEEKPLVNGHADANGKEKSSRKQKQPVKRIDNEGAGGSSGASGSGGGSTAHDNSSTSENDAPGGSASSGGSSTSNSSSIKEVAEDENVGGSSSGGSSSKYSAVENEDEDSDEDYDPNEQDDEEDDDESDDDDDEDDEESGDEEEFEDSEGVNFMHGTGDDVGQNSGTTAIVALIFNSKLYVANVGDSRCVLCRNGGSYEMSIDHKPQDEEEKQRIEAAGGKLTLDGRVNGGLNLSRALGDHIYKQNKDLPAEAQMISPLPDIRETQLTKDDSFMVMACDGIWNVMTNEEVIEFVKKRLPKEEGDEKFKLSTICEELFDNCIAPDTNNDGTGCDNMTCLIVRFKHDENGNIRLSGQTKRTKSPTPSDDGAAQEEGAANSKSKSKKARMS